MSDNFLETTSEIKAALRQHSDTLGYLADCLYVTGNTVLADKLASASENLEHQRKRLDDCVGAKIHSDYRESVEATGNVLMAALAGITAGARSERST